MIMKKLLLSVSLLICPMVFTFGQLSLSGLAGKNGYSVLNASFTAGVPFVPGLSLVPKYSLLEQDNTPAISQYGLGANLRLPFIDIVEVGADAYYIPKSNNYSAFSYDLHGAVNVENLLFRLLPTDTLKLGAGVRTIYHSFYDPDYDNTEVDGYGFLNIGKGGLDASVTYVKALSYSNTTNGIYPPWLNLPYFTAIYNGYLDYSLGLGVGYTYKFIRPFVAYNFLRTEGAPSTDDAKVGLTVRVLMVDINAAVEWLNFSQNTENRKTFFSLTAGVSIL